MIKWRNIFYILISILYSKFNNIKCGIKLGNQNNFNTSNLEYFQLEPRKVQIKYLDYINKNQFVFKNINETNNLLVNFHSIDCDIKITNNSNTHLKINEIKKNIFSILIQNNEINNTKLLVDPFINSGNNDKYKQFRKCPVVINSLYINEFKINIEEKESMTFNFNENLPYIILLYKINNLKEGNFIILSFSFEENCTFNIDINNESNKIISNSSNIFLDYFKLSKIKDGILTIKITLNKGNSLTQVNNPVLIFKLIESNSISILRKNILNLGFTTSKKENQYYYLEVLKGEEGEIMLHNKRLDGELFGVIKPKSNINPYNKDAYAIKDKNIQLKFEVNTLKLNFKSYQTEQCEEGCYLFIIFSHDDYDYTPTVAFEYTLLVRIWDEEEMSPQIINIPFNEYIFGTFEEEDLYNHHYYSLNIPKDLEEIIIQFEGDYIEGFIGIGKRKLHTLRKLNNTINLNIKDDKMILKYNKSTLNGLNKSDCISLAFRSRNYFKRIFSFYHFRILFLRKGENNIIYPLDSNIGNFCAPQKEGNEYFCSCLLKNNYNEFYLNYSISTSNKIDKLNLNYFNLVNGKIKCENVIKYASQEKYDNNFSLIKFRFLDDKIVNILSTLSNKKRIIYPQIYSAQMYDLREDKDFIFNLNQNLLLILKYIQGGGVINYNNLIFNPNVNYKGKPLFFVFKESNKMSFQCKELIFYTRFEKINEIKKITQGEALRDVVKAKMFPIYYYIKNDEDQINNMIINFRIKLIKNQRLTSLFEIKGYIMNETKFNDFNQIRFNGEFLDLDYYDPINGSYDISFESGILNINETINKGEYILIKIDSSLPSTDNNILIEILTMLKKDGNYILPIYNYITDIYDNTENKTYKIIIYEEDKKNTDILVEFIPNCSRMTISSYFDKESNMIKMENISDNNGIVQKYRITDFNDDFILKVSAPQEISYGKYIIKYYFIKNHTEQFYKLNKAFTKKKGNKKNDIILEFNELEIIKRTRKRKIVFKINGFIYRSENDIKNEFINTSETLNENVIRSFAYSTNNSFNLYFSNIESMSSGNNYKFNLQINLIAEINLFYDEFYIFRLPINLEEELKNGTNYLWLIIVSSIIFVVILIIILFTIGIIILKKNNMILQKKVLATSFSSDKIDENILEKALTLQKDENNENIFI